MHLLALSALLSSATAGGLLEIPECDTCSVIIVSEDVFRAASSSAHGFGLQTTPAEAHVASKGVRFDHAYSPAAWTVPSVASLMHLSHVPDTNLLFSWSVKDENWNPISPRVVSIADAAHAQGMEAHAIIEQVVFRPILRMWQDFDSVQMFEPETQPIDAVLAKVKELRAADKRFVLYVHLWGSHIPLQPPVDYRGLFTEEPLVYPGKGFKKPKEGAPKEAGDRYALAYHQQMRWYEDAAMRMIRGLESDGAFDNTFLMMTADHGTTLGETTRLPYHYQWAAYEEVLRVPMVMMGPGIKPGTVIDRPVAQIDVARTALSAVGVKTPEGAPWRALDLRTESPDLVVSYAVRTVSVRSATHRCDLSMEEGGLSCFAHGSQEKKVPVGKVPRGAEMGTLARKVLSESRALNRGVKNESRRVDEADIEALKSIGYVE